MNPPALTATYTYNSTISTPSSASTTATTTTTTNNNDTSLTTITATSASNVIPQESKTFTHDLPPPPSHTINSRNVDHHIEPLHTEPDLQSRTHHLRYLRTAVVDLQKELNAFLTAKMEEEKMLLSRQELANGGLEGDNEVEGEEEEELDEETKRLEAEVERQRREDEEQEKGKRMKGKSSGSGGGNGNGRKKEKVKK